MHPAHRVEDVGVVGRDLQRAGDQILGLAETFVAIGEGVAERVVRLRVVGPQRHQPPQMRLHDFDAIDLLRRHRRVVQQRGVVRHARQRRGQEVEGLAVALGFAQQLATGDDDLRALFGILRRGVREQAPALVDALHLAEQQRLADARIQELRPVVDAVEPLDCVVIALVFLGEPREVEVRRIRRALIVRLRFERLQIALEVAARVRSVCVRSIDSTPSAYRASSDCGVRLITSSNCARAGASWLSAISSRP